MAGDNPSFDRGSSRSRSKSSGIGAESPDSGLDDMRQFKEKLSNKQLTLQNASETVKTFMEKRGSIETFVGEMFSEFGSEEQTYENMKNSEQYMDSDGYVRLDTLKKAEDQIDILKRIIEWREVQLTTTMVLIRKMQELISRQQGNDMSRQVVEEVKDVFQQKFESEEDKLQTVKDIIEDNVENREKNIRQDMQDLRQNQRRIMYEMQSELNKTNEVLNALGEQLDTSFTPMEFSDELQQMIDEYEKQIEKMQSGSGSFELDEDELMGKSKPDTQATEPGDNNQETVSREEKSNAPSQVVGKMEESSSSNEENLPDPEDLDDWTVTDVSVERVENPEFGFTERLNPEDVAGVQWDALRQLDKGHKTLDEIREASILTLGSYPKQTLENLINHGDIREEELPDQIVANIDP